MTHETRLPPHRANTAAQAAPRNGGGTGNLSSNFSPLCRLGLCKTQDPRPVYFALGLRSLQAEAMLTRCKWIFWGCPQDRYVLRFDYSRMLYAVDRIENQRAHSTEHFANIRDAIGRALFHNLVDCENVVVEGWL